MTLSYLFLSLTLNLITSCTAADWCYEIQPQSNKECKEPSHWKDLYAYCGGNKQSPINIVTCNAKFDSQLKPFKFEGYDKENDFSLTNNGHSAVLNLGGQETIKMSGGGLPGAYIATQLHFHWGSKDKPGSEHSLNGEKYPIELHIVHQKKAKQSKSTDESTKSEDLAVLGFLYEEGPQNDNYFNLIDGFKKITSNGNSTIISKVKLQDLIPKAEELKVFYRYEGSLTTPLCSEVVNWTVFPATIKLSKSQIEEFSTKLHYSDGSVMNQNFRPIQNRNERTIYTSGVNAILPHTGYLLILLFVFYLTAIS